MSKTTTPQQYEKLAEMMAAEEDIAQGFQKRSKEEVQAFWQKIGNTLNELGPPSKDPSTWRKVWIDWKCYIKRKVRNNKIEMMGTGGGRGSLQPISPLEEKVIVLAGLTTLTNGISGALDFGHNVEVKEIVQTSDTMDISVANSDPVLSTTGASSQQREKMENTSSSLREEINLKKESYAETQKYNHPYEVGINKMEEMGTYLRRMNRSLEKIADTTAKQLQEEQRHNKVKEELLKQKIKIKMQMLQLQQQHYNPDYDMQ